jgi:hypothetical protein
VSAFDRDYSIVSDRQAWFVTASRKNSLSDITAFLLSVVFFIALCSSLILVAADVSPAFHIDYSSARATAAILGVGLFGLCAATLSVRAFSFGYVVGFYMLAITGGYIWLSYFTPLPYDHQAARWSAALSSVLFFLAATVKFTSPPKFPTLSIAQMDSLVKCLIGVVVAVALYGAFGSGLHLVGPFAGEFIRSELKHPIWLDYAISISLSCLIPFTFAWLTQRRAYLTAAACIVVALTFYPIAVNKTALIAPFWLIFVFLLLKFCEPRIATIVSFLIPLSLGLVAQLADPSRPELAFRVINFRMLAIPSSGLDHYYHYFSGHPLTHFCQVSVLGKLFSCALPDQLGALMERQYEIGNFNASVLATEGIASLGLYLAPIGVVLCGFVICFGNLTSTGLAPSFVIQSSSVLAVMLMNVPLSVTMVSHGGSLLFGLWLITPRSATDEKF